MSVKQQRAHIGELVEDATVRLDEYVWVRMGGMGGEGVHPGYFDGVQPLLMDDGISSPNYLMPTDVTLSDLDKALDVCVLVRDTDNDLPLFIRIRQVGIKEVRGKVALLMPVMVEISTAFSRVNSRTIEMARQIQGMRPDGHWVGLDHNITNRDDRTKGPVNKDNFSVYCGLQFSNGFWWQAYIGRPGKPKVRIPTDPMGAMVLFKDRDKPDGSRRSPLRHWADEHWMQMRSDPESETFVRTHLRGTSEFMWHGYECRLVPSAKEQSVAELAVMERSQLRDERRDRKGIGEAVAIARPWWYKVWLRLRQSK